MRQTIIEALAWALEVDPAALKWPAAVLVALCFGLVLFGLVQYQAFNRLWGIQLVLGLAGGAVVVGLGAAAFHWFLGVLYGVGYLLTWLVWVLTRRWSGWRRALARGLTAGITIGPWLWIGATEKEMLVGLASRGAASAMAKWLPAPNGLIWFWMLLGALWLLVLVGGWSCWRWPLVRPQRRRWLVVTWAVLGVLGLNWYAAGRVSPMVAIQNGQHWRLAYVLVSRPGSQWYRDQGGWTPLHWVAPSGEAGALRLLLAAGADVNAKTKDGVTSLHLAAARDDATPLRLLLDAGADVNAKTKDGDTPLHSAALFGKAEGLRLLLAAGADVHAKANDGVTSLHRAAQHGHAEAIHLLLAAGADANAKDMYGKTPLHWATLNGNAEALRILLAAGADAQAKDNYGGTPLHSAAGTYGNATALGLLLATGARINERNAKGETALDLSTKDECRQLLRQAGGKTGKDLDAGQAKPAQEPVKPPEPGR